MLITKVRFLAMAILLPVAAGIMSGCHGPAQSADTGQEQLGRAVRVTEAQSTSDAANGIELSGVVRSKGQVRLGFQTGGLVTEVLVEEGQDVTKGQVLARLDAVPFRAQRDQASGMVMQASAMVDLYEEGTRGQELSIVQARVRSAQAASDMAEADYKRVQTLYAEGVVAHQQLDAAYTGYVQAGEALRSAREQLALAEEGPRRQEIDSARAQLKQAQGMLAAAQRQLEYTTLTAPNDGTVVWRDLEVGMTVKSGDAVIELANITSLEVESEIPEGNLADFKVGGQADVKFPALPSTTAKAEIISIAPMAQQVTRSFPVRLRLVDPDPAVLPGMVALLHCKNGFSGGGARIPTRSIIDNTVFVVQNGQAVQTDVTVIMEKGEYSYVEGIEAGAQVVVNGQHYLNDGEKCEIVGAMAIEEITGLTRE